MAAEADQPGFVRVQGEIEQAHPFLQVVQERLRFILVLKADNRIVGKADHDHVSGGLVASPLVDLTPRENEILRYVVLGYTNREIAMGCATSPNTVRNQLDRKSVV